MTIYTGKRISIDDKRYRVADCRNTNLLRPSEVTELRNWTWPSQYRNGKVVQIDDQICVLTPA